MRKNELINYIDATRDSANRLHADRLDPAACVEIARLYVSNKGPAKTIYSFEKLAHYITPGIPADFVSKVVKRSIVEGLIPNAMCEQIMKQSAGNQKRNADFQGNYTSTERSYSQMIYVDRFNAVKNLPASDPKTYDSLWRLFLDPETVSFKRLKNIYGYSKREIMYFVMIAAIRDMPDTSYDKFKKVVLDAFDEDLFYMDYVRFVGKARKDVQALRDPYLELYKASKTKKNATDPAFQAEFEAAKKALYDAVDEIISKMEADISQFRAKMFGD